MWPVCEYAKTRKKESSRFKSSSLPSVKSYFDRFFHFLIISQCCKVLLQTCCMMSINHNFYDYQKLDFFSLRFNLKYCNALCSDFHATEKIAKKSWLEYCRRGLDQYTTDRNNIRAILINAIWMTLYCNFDEKIVLRIYRSDDFTTVYK